MLYNFDHNRMLYFYIGYFFFWFFIPIVFFYFIFFVMGWTKTLKRKKELSRDNFIPILKSISLPEITFIVPMYNEALNIMATIENLQHLSYRYKEILLVNDGSTDGTMDLLTKNLMLQKIPKFFKEHLPTAKIKAVYQSQLYQDFYVIDKEHAGKFDCLNAGINMCRHDLFIGVDADTIIESDTFEGMIRPIFSESNPVAVGSTIRLLNGCDVGFRKIGTLAFPEGFLAGMQSLEYLRSFIQRQSLEYFGGYFVMAGAFTVLRKDHLIKIGGYKKTVGEDMEVIMALQYFLRKSNQPDTMLQLADPVAWTVAPNSFKVLGRQRSRWQRGLCESLWIHRRMFLNPRFGLYGLFVIPFCIIWSEVLEPFVELLAYVYAILGLVLGYFSLKYFLIFFIAAYFVSFVNTIFALFIEESSFRRFSSPHALFYLLWYSLIENIGYRQCTILWRIRGTLEFIKERFIKRNGFKWN